MARRQSSNLIFVHHKRTGEVDICRVDGFSKRRKTPHTPRSCGLHYISTDLSKFCRCPNPRRHRFLSPVASESTRLAANLTQFLEQHDLEASSLTHFCAYRQQQQAVWAHEGVCIADFHYATRQKDVVCRCTKPNNHGQGVVRNHDIVELCAEFFRRNQNKMTCTRAQWHMACVVSKGDHSPDSDSFKYDSRSFQELLHNHKQELLNHPLPSPRSDLKQFFSGPNGYPDIPEQVWENARPSLWNSRRGSETSCSTPLGTAATPQTPVGGPAHMSGRRHSVALEQSRRSAVATVWSTIQRDAAGEAQESARNSSQAPMTSSRRSSLGSQSNHLTRSRGLGDRIAQPGLETVCPKPSPVELAVNVTPVEVPYFEPSAELPTEYAYSNSLRELEDSGRYVDYDRLGKQSFSGVKMSSSQRQQSPVNISSIHDAAEMPSQREYVSRHVLTCSDTNPPPIGDCSLCTEPYRSQSKSKILLPSCGHFLHKRCLIADFRIRDETIGQCPMCGIALCQRTLIDRIQTDREAIFHTQFTKLANEVRIEFPHRGETALLESEEELAAAQLRLLKDYVDAHTQDTWVHGDSVRAESNWYAAVIEPATKLFKGWNKSSQQSKYFTDHDAFVEILAWAELVRFMSVRIRGHECSELHREFMLVIRRSGDETKSWKCSHSGVLACETIVQDACSVALICTRSS
jgi:hypothetical protein